MGAWIEISMIFWVLMMVHVALSMGAWIEIVSYQQYDGANTVALYMGARINIIFVRPSHTLHNSRTLHGCADQHGKYGWLVVMASDCTF